MREPSSPRFEIEPEGRIGVDVGGSGARVWRVVAERGGSMLSTAGRGVEIGWPESNWQPRPLAEQLADPPAPLDAAERSESSSRLEALTGAIASVGSSPVVALAVPGLRTPDDRGLAVVANGPRIPDFLDELGRRLGTASLFFCSDGLGGAWGEAVGREGGLWGRERGAYVGGGSGLAEGILVGGRAREIPTVWRKAWQPTEGRRRSFEQLLAPSHLNREWARLAAEGAPPLERSAAEGDPAARELLAEVGRRLASYVEYRRAQYHATFGAPLERIVVGQALARVLGGRELPGGVVLSSLREAPAIGAVAASCPSAGGGSGA